MTREGRGFLSLAVLSLSIHRIETKCTKGRITDISAYFSHYMKLPYLSGGNHGTIAFADVDPEIREEFAHLPTSSQHEDQMGYRQWLSEKKTHCNFL